MSVIPEMYELLESSKFADLARETQRVWSKVRPQEGDAEETATRLVKAMRKDRRLMQMFHALKPFDIKYRLKDLADSSLESWFRKKGVDQDPEMQKVRKEMLKFVPSFKKGMNESRPGPHWNPWPQKKTTAAELAKSLVELAKFASKYPVARGRGGSRARQRDS
jgi:hypothetical protein